MKNEINHNNKIFKYVGCIANLLIYGYEDLRILVDENEEVYFEYKITSNSRLLRKNEKNM